MHKQPGTMDANPFTDESRRGQWLLICGGVLLGTIGVFVEEAGQHPLVTVWFRCAFGAFALLVVGVLIGRLGELKVTAQTCRIAIITGVLMILNWALFFAAISKTSIALATVVFHIQPFWVLLFGIFFLRETASPLKSFATVIALFGLILTTGLLNNGLASDIIDSDYIIGIVMCLGGSLSYSAVTIIAKTERRLTSFSLAWWQCAVGAVILAWSPLLHGWPQEASAWAWLAGLGVFHTGLAYAILFAGMARLSLGNVALLQFVYPLTAVVIDWAVYGRVLEPVQLLGVGLMTVALWAIRSER